MSDSDTNDINLQSLQQYDWTQNTIEHIINFIENGILPEDMNARQKRRFKSNFKDNFIIKNTNGETYLYYEPLNLRVVPSDNEELKNKILLQLYETPEAIGKGQNNFHQLVLQKYLGIKRTDVINFLKLQPEYQMVQNKPRQVTKSLQPQHPLHYVAIDIVDMDYLSIKKDNKPFKYILSLLDLYTNFAWFVGMKKKDASSVLEAFKSVLTYNLRFHDEETQRRMREENLYDYPKVIVSDEGGEFEGEFLEFLREKKIKSKTTSSYSPQSNIEALNGVLRNLLRANFIRNNKLIWKPYLEDLMKSKNSNRDERTGQTPEKMMKIYFNNSREPNTRKIIIKSKNRMENKTRKMNNKIERFKNQTLEKGDYVRVKLANFQSYVRNKIKSGNMKKLVVRFTPEVYKVDKVIPSNKVGDLPRYTLKTKNGIKIKNDDSKVRVFKGVDLLKVPKDTKETSLTLKSANMLNYPNGKKDEFENSDTLRDLRIIRRRTMKKQTNPTGSSSRTRKVKPIDEYGSSEWKKILINKEFNDEGIRWVIVNVLHDREADVFMAIYIKKGERNIIRNRERTPLKEVFDLARKSEETWVLPEYYEGRKIG
jgi:hypothetical protein